MKLSHYDIENQIDFEENAFQLLVVENSKEYYKLVSQLIGQSNGEDGEFILFEEKENIDIEKKVVVIHDFFTLDCNTKKIENALNSLSLEILNDGDFVKDLNEINNIYMKINERVIQNLDVSVQYNDNLSVTDFIKLSHYKIVNDENILDRIASYVSVSQTIRGVKLVVLVGSFAIFSEEQINELLKQFSYMQMSVLFVESYKKYDIEKIQTRIIDSDLCFI